MQSSIHYKPILSIISIISHFPFNTLYTDYIGILKVIYRLYRYLHTTIPIIYNIEYIDYIGIIFALLLGRPTYGASTCTEGTRHHAASDPRSVAKELPPTVDTDVLPLGPLSPGGPRTGGKPHCCGNTSPLRLAILPQSPSVVPRSGTHQPLTHSGHGNVSVLHSDIPHANNVSAEAARVTIRRVTGAQTLGHRQSRPTSTCPVCDTRGNAQESLN